MTTKEINLRTKMIANARCYFSNLTEGYLQSKSTEALLCYTHPEDRPTFEFKLSKVRERELINE